MGAPQFTHLSLEDRREDGYWIESLDVNNNGRPDIVAYGLNSGLVKWYENPGQEDHKGWGSHEIGKLHQPVGMHHGDLTGDGYNDIIICSEYGATMVDINEKGGLIHWLRNPLGQKGEHSLEWDQFYIGRATGMHRLAVGHFTQTKQLEVLGLPIVGRANDTHSPVQVKLFQQPDDILTAEAWNETLITDTFFHVIHGVSMKKYRGYLGDERDSVLLASQEGITWLYYDTEWRWKVLVSGVERGPSGGYWGSESVDMGRIGDDPFAYIVTAGPFHGNVLELYIRQSGVVGDLDSATWERHVLDIVGNNGNTIYDGNGPIHHVLCGDFDNDGDDEFLVALRDNGVLYCKAEELMKGNFSVTTVATESAARIATADFNLDGRLDFATIGYGVQGYYMADDVKLNVYTNTFAGLHEGISTALLQDTEVQIDIGRTDDVTRTHLLTMNRFKYELVTMPPWKTLPDAEIGTMIKVISGRVTFRVQSSAAPLLVTNTVEPQGSRNLTITSDEHTIRTVEGGAAFLMITPYFNTRVQDFPLVRTVQDANATIVADPVNGDSVPFQFQEYQGMGFYNMTGFTVRKLGFKLCHIQFWLADKGINCGIHDHSDGNWTTAFCEIHFCLVNGTGQGGMFRYTGPPDTPMDNLPMTDFTKVLVPSGFEHGPLWDVDSNGRPVRRPDGSVVYRAHCWKAGNGDPLASSFPSMDFWTAVELNPDIAFVDTVAGQTE